MRSLRSSPRISLVKKNTSQPGSPVAKFVIVEFLNKLASKRVTSFEIVGVGIIRGSYAIGGEVSYLSPNTKGDHGETRKMRRGRIRGHYMTRIEAQNALNRFRANEEGKADKSQCLNKIIDEQVDSYDSEPSTSTTTKLLAAAISCESDNIQADKCPKLEIDIKMEPSADFYEAPNLRNSKQRKEQRKDQYSSQNLLSTPPTLVNEGGLMTNANRDDNMDADDDGCNNGQELYNSAEDQINNDDDGPDNLEMEADEADDMEETNLGNDENTRDSSPPSLTPICITSQRPARETSMGSASARIGSAASLLSSLTNDGHSTASSQPTIREILSVVLQNQLLIMQHLKQNNETLQAAEEKTREMLASNDALIKSAVNVKRRTNGYSLLRPVRNNGVAPSTTNSMFTPTTSSTGNSNLIALQPVSSFKDVRILKRNAPSSSKEGTTEKITLAEALGIRVVKPKRANAKLEQNEKSGSLGGPNSLRAISSAGSSRRTLEERPRTSATASIASTTPICLLHFQNGMPLLKDSTSPEMEFDVTDKSSDGNIESAIKRESEEDDLSANIFSDLPPLKPETI